jgi:hypothetical protein
VGVLLHSRDGGGWLEPVEMWGWSRRTQCSRSPSTSTSRRRMSCATNGGEVYQPQTAADLDHSQAAAGRDPDLRIGARLNRGGSRLALNDD